MIIRTFVAAAVFAFGINSAAFSQDVIAARQDLMKTIGKNAQLGTKMIRGEEPFDLAKAQAIFAAYQDAAAKEKNLWPENSKTGGNTSAKPEIWTNMSDFQAKLAKFAADAKEAAGKVKDLDSFKAAFPNVGKNCGGCHEAYRLKKS